MNSDLKNNDILSQIDFNKIEDIRCEIKKIDTEIDAEIAEINDKVRPLLEEKREIWDRRSSISHWSGIAGWFAALLATIYFTAEMDIDSDLAFLLVFFFPFFVVGFFDFIFKVSALSQKEEQSVAAIDKRIAAIDKRIELFGVGISSFKRRELFGVNIPSFLRLSPPYYSGEDYPTNRKTELKTELKEIQEDAVSVLDDYKDNYLYKKRADNRFFHEHLAEYEQAINFMQESNTIGDGLWDHKAYLSNRKNVVPRGSYISRPKIEFKNTIKETIIEAGDKMSTLPIQRTQPNQTKDKDSVRIVRQVDIDNSIIEESIRIESGRSAEEAVVDFEREKLIENNLPSLAKQVFHSSKELGDGLGYDVLSFLSNGEKKYIEVKGTQSKSATTNFIFTKNEVAFLRQNPSNSFVYCVFGVGTSSARLKIYPAKFIVGNVDSVVSFNVKI